MRSIVFDLFIDLLIEPLVLGVGHFVLSAIGIKPLRTKWLDVTLATTVGIGVWVVVVGTIGWLVS